MKNKLKINKPLVSIRCITYNHEKYIAQCLDGFLMQQTAFPFVAIVHDDASTDGTAEIVRQYAKRYPDIIKPIFETENQYSKNDDSLSRIMAEAINATGAKYVAICEGDDYWIDPEKLQKQVDFLDLHPDYILCYHNRYVQKEGKPYNDGFVPKKVQLEKNESMFHAIPTQTVLHRNCISIEDSNFSTLDATYWMYLSIRGNFQYLDFYGAVYRIHNGGLWNGSSFLNNYTRSINARIGAFKYMGGVNKHDLAIVINDWIKERVKCCLQNRIHYTLIIGDLCRFMYFAVYSHIWWKIKEIFHKVQ